MDMRHLLRQNLLRQNLLMLIVSLFAFPVMAQQLPEWQSQYAIGLNKLAPHTNVWPYGSATEVKSGHYEQSP